MNMAKRKSQQKSRVKEKFVEYSKTYCNLESVAVLIFFTLIAGYSFNFFSGLWFVYLLIIIGLFVWLFRLKRQIKQLEKQILKEI